MTRRTTPIRVVIADDHPIIRDGIRALLSNNPRITIVGQAGSFDEVLTVVQQTSTDVIILDLGGMAGAQSAPVMLVRELQQHHPAIAIVVFSSITDLAPELLKAGVRAYIAKEDQSNDLALGVEAAFHGRQYLSPAIVRYLDQIASDPLQDRLLPREFMTLKLLAKNLSTVEIAEQMGIDPRSVQNYITALRRKTGSNGRQQLIDWYRRVYGDPDVFP